MNDWGLLAVCIQGYKYLDESKKKFVTEMRMKLMKRETILTGAQSQYLQSCYDNVITKYYGLENTSLDREYAKNRTIYKNRKT